MWHQTAGGALEGLAKDFPARCKVEAMRDKPPRFEGGTLANFGPGGDVCQQMAKYVISINNLDRKYIKSGYNCQFLGPHNVGKLTFSGKCVCT